MIKDLLNKKIKKITRYALGSDLENGISPFLSDGITQIETEEGRTFSFMASPESYSISMKKNFTPGESYILQNEMPELETFFGEVILNIYSYNEPKYKELNKALLLIELSNNKKICFYYVSDNGIVFDAHQLLFEMPVGLTLNLDES